MFYVNIVRVLNEFFSYVEKVLSVFKNYFKSFWNETAYPTLKTFLEQNTTLYYFDSTRKCLRNKYFNFSVVCYAEFLKEVNNYDASRKLIKRNVDLQVKPKQYMFVLNK